MGTLRLYVKDVLTTFKNDDRILCGICITNPATAVMGAKACFCYREIFKWARQVNPAQPLTAGVWLPTLTDLNTFQLNNSDIITYHNYNKEDEHALVIDSLKNMAGP